MKFDPDEEKSIFYKFFFLSFPVQWKMDKKNVNNLFVLKMNRCNKTLYKAFFFFGIWLE